MKKSIALLAAVLSCVIGLTACTDNRANACRASGGFTRDSSQWNPGLTSSGKFTMTYVTIRYCFRDDKIVDIWQA